MGFLTEEIDVAHYRKKLQWFNGVQKVPKKSFFGLWKNTYAIDMHFSLWIWKLHVWEKSGSWVLPKKLSWPFRLLKFST